MKTHLSGLDVLEDRWLLSAGAAAAVLPSGAIAETSNGVEVAAPQPPIDDTSISSDGGPAITSVSADGESAAPSQTPAAMDAAVLAIAPSYVVLSPALTVANDTGSGTDQANGGAVAIAPTTRPTSTSVSLKADTPAAFDATTEDAATSTTGINQAPVVLSTPLTISWGGRMSPIIRGAFKRARNLPISWSFPSEDPSATTTAGEPARQTSSRVFEKTLADDADEEEAALVPQSDDEPVFLTDAVTARTVTVNIDLRRSERDVQEFVPYTRRNHDRSVPGCIAQDVLPSSAMVAAGRSPQRPNDPLIAPSARPADLLDGFVPFDRTELEQSIDRVLARFGELEVGTALVDTSDWWVSFPIVPVTALGVAALVQYQRRRGLNGDRAARDNVASYTLGLPEHPCDWACEPR